jgi:hypothetical protein
LAGERFGHLQRLLTSIENDEIIPEAVHLVELPKHRRGLKLAGNLSPLLHPSLRVGAKQSMAAFESM